MAMIKRGKAEQRAARTERLSAALRENLKRRKDQARGRATSPGNDAEIPAADPDFRRNPGSKSDSTGRPGTGRGGS
jgi:hypothetical protein